MPFSPKLPPFEDFQKLGKFSLMVESRDDINSWGRWAWRGQHCYRAWYGFHQAKLVDDKGNVIPEERWRNNNAARAFILHIVDFCREQFGTSDPFRWHIEREQNILYLRDKTDAALIRLTYS